MFLIAWQKKKFLLIIYYGKIWHLILSIWLSLGTPRTFFSQHLHLCAFMSANFQIASFNFNFLLSWHQHFFQCLSIMQQEDKCIDGHLELLRWLTRVWTRQVFDFSDSDQSKKKINLWGRPDQKIRKITQNNKSSNMLEIN